MQRLLLRYIAIVHPLKPRMSKCVARFALVVIWTGSALLSLPALIYSEIHTFS